MVPRFSVFYTADFIAVFPRCDLDYGAIFTQNTRQTNQNMSQAQSSPSPNTSTRKRKQQQSSSPPPHSRYHRMLFIGQAPGPTSTSTSTSSSSSSSSTTSTSSSSSPPPALEGLSGSRLARLAGLPPSDLWARCDRINLLSHFPGTKPKAPSQLDETYQLHQSSGDYFNLKKARAAADAMDITSYHLVVLLGLNVARAFRLQHPSLFAQYFIDIDLKIKPIKEGTTTTTKRKKKRKKRKSTVAEEEEEREKEEEEEVATGVTTTTTTVTKGWNGRSTLILVYPHPSGVSHFWNSR